MALRHVSPLVGRLGIAEAVLPHLTHLAVGDGPGGAAPAPGATALQHELGRTRFLERFFVVPDPAGSIIVPGGIYRPSDVPTNEIYFRFRFLAGEALGTWSEFALCGFGVSYVQRGALFLNGPQAGDDLANTIAASLLGSYVGAENQTITVAVTTGGGSGVARVAWTSTGSLPPATNQLVTFGAPLAVGVSGLSLLFAGGGDGVLTLGDQWVIRATAGAQTTDYASGGVYDPIGNEMGQVLAAGRVFSLAHEDEPQTKGATSVDVQRVFPVLRVAA